VNFVLFVVKKDLNTKDTKGITKNTKAEAKRKKEQVE